MQKLRCAAGVSIFSGPNRPFSRAENVLRKSEVSKLSIALTQTFDYCKPLLSTIAGFRFPGIRPWHCRTIISDGEHMIVRLLPRIVVCGNVGFTELVVARGRQTAENTYCTFAVTAGLPQSKQRLSYFDHCEGNISCRYKFGTFLVFPCFLIQLHFFKK